MCVCVCVCVCVWVGGLVWWLVCVGMCVRACACGRVLIHHAHYACSVYHAEDGSGAVTKAKQKERAARAKMRTTFWCETYWSPSDFWKPQLAFSHLSPDFMRHFTLRRKAWRQFLTDLGMKKSLLPHNDAVISRKLSFPSVTMSPGLPAPLRVLLNMAMLANMAMFKWTDSESRVAQLLVRTFLTCLQRLRLSLRHSPLPALFTKGCVHGEHRTR